MTKKFFIAILIALLNLSFVNAKTIQSLVDDNLVTIDINNYDQLDNEGKDLIDALEQQVNEAVSGAPQAQCKLGYLHEAGTLVNQDYNLALYWYNKAADQGDDLAINNLGNAYEKGSGVPQNSKVATEYYLKSAKMGNTGVWGME